MTVLQVIPRLDEGGAERGTLDIAGALVRSGARALVVTAGGRLEDSVARTGAELVRLPVASKNPLTIIANGFRLARLIARERIDIVHARSRAPAWSALIAAHLARVPLVTTHHGIYRGRFALKRWYSSVMTRGDRVIANSAHVAERIRDAYPAAASRMAVIPRGVDLAAFDPRAVAAERVRALKRRWGVPEGARVVLLPGRLSRWKGQDLFIAAARLLAREPAHADAVFVLAGGSESPQLQAELAAQAQQAGLGARILFAGHCDDMPAAYAAASVVVSASREPEPFGRVLIEAQAMGAIVVAADHGGARETVHVGPEATGFRVPPGDAAALAKGIAEALALAPETRAAMAARARAYVAEKFSLERMCADTLSVYRELLAAHAPAARPHIAVIKLGALGDVVQALAPFRTIRAHHKNAHITLITTPPYAAFCRATGYFDAVWDEGRPRTLAAYLRLIRRMRRARFHRVYDLQTSTRSSLYYWMLFPRLPEWSGIALGCSHPHDNPRRDRMHTLDRQAEQLAKAGVVPMLPADLGWAEGDAARFGLKPPYALLVPGGSVHRPRKRWPIARFAGLAQRLAESGVTPAVLGAPDEAALGEAVAKACAKAQNLVGQTSLADIIVLGRGAAIAVGNDTGPMHLLAAAGAPCLVLFSAESDPALCAPRGPAVKILRERDLAALAVEHVWAALGPLGAERIGKAADAGDVRRGGLS